jgi:5-methylcytosine-specific restriction endonuclease McrA
VTDDEKKAHRKMRRAIEKRYRDSHPEYRKKKIERATKWKAANRDRVNELDKKIRDRDPNIHRARGKKWRDANPEKVKAQANARYAAKTADKPKRVKVTAEHTRARKSESIKKWRSENREKVRADKRAWRAAHPGSNSERSKRWVERNPEKARASNAKRTAKWAAANPDKVSVIAARARTKREAKVRNAGSFTLPEWQKLLDDTGYKCLCCGIPEAESIYRFPKKGIPLVGQLTRDHIIPLSKGGRGTIDNIAPLCLPCNMRKHAKHIDYRAHHGTDRHRSAAC